MSRHVRIEIELPEDLEKFRLPSGVNHRLQELLDRQDQGRELTHAEKQEAEGLVSLAEVLFLLRMRAQRISSPGPHGPRDLSL